MAIFQLFPRESYIGAGEAKDGHLSLVVVLADGYYKSALEGRSMPESCRDFNSWRMALVLGDKLTERDLNGRRWN
jgi:hypothetical protein